MLLKSADDKSRRVRLLEELRQSPVLDARQRTWLEDELKHLQSGIAGERSAAHYLDNDLKDDLERLQAQFDLRDLWHKGHFSRRQVLLEQRSALRRVSVLPRAPGGPLTSDPPLSAGARSVAHRGSHRRCAPITQTD